MQLTADGSGQLLSVNAEIADANTLNKDTQ